MTQAAVLHQLNVIRNNRLTHLGPIGISNADIHPIATVILWIGEH
jgi:hypothetical protein